MTGHRRPRRDRRSARPLGSYDGVHGDRSRHRSDRRAERSRLRRVPGDRRRLVVPPPALRAVRACRLLRLVAVAARQPARGGDRAPDRPELRAGRGLVLELRDRRRSRRDCGSRRRTTTRSTSPSPARPAASRPTGSTTSTDGPAGRWAPGPPARVVSWAIGAPRSAMPRRPMNFSTVPPNAPARRQSVSPDDRPSSARRRWTRPWPVPSATALANRQAARTSDPPSARSSIGSAVTASTHEPVRRAIDEDLAWLGGLLEPGSRVERVPGGEGGPVGRLVGHDLARLDTHPQLARASRDRGGVATATSQPRTSIRPDRSTSA